MRAIILAAGRGSRMKSLTDDKPKCLVEYKGKSLLEWRLAAIRGAGIEEIAIVTGYKRELLADKGLVEFHNPRWAETNMVSSLSCASEWLKAGPCVISYSDIFYDSSAVLSLMSSTADLAVTYDPNWLELWKKRFQDPLVDAETFKMSADSFLEEIGNKPQSIDEIQGQYMGLLRFSPLGWSYVERLRSDLTPVECDKMHMTGTLQLAIQRGHKVLAIPYSGHWGEIDSLDDLIACES